MQVYEIDSVLSYSHYRTKSSWEQARLICYTIAQTNSTKPIDFDSFLRFGWEKEVEESYIEPTTEERERILQQLKEEEQKLNNNGIGFSSKTHA